jgi:hypothetical protein
MRAPSLRNATLSVVIPVGSSPERPRKILEIFRPLADEIIVSADSKAREQVIAGLGDIADRMLVHDLEGGSPCSAYPWLQHQARGDWIFQIEDDMVPSARLLAALPEMLRDRWLSAFVLRRRWLWEDTGHYLGGFPWATDWAGRLLRNVPGLWMNDGSLHSRPEVLGEYHLAPDELYHLTFLLEDQASREAKSENYEQMDQVVFDEYNVNDLYFPERLDELEIRDVPADDRQMLDFVMEDNVVPDAIIEANRGIEPEQVAGRAELSAYFYARPAPDDPSAREVELEFIEARDSVTFGGGRLFMISLTNNGSEVLPPGRHPAAGAVVTRWLDQDGAPYPVESEVNVLHETLHPGGQSLIGVMPTPPSVTGHFSLEARPMVMGSGPVGAPIRTEVEVLAPDESKEGVVTLGNRELRRDNERLSRDLREERTRRETAERTLSALPHRLVERGAKILSRRRSRQT